MLVLKRREGQWVNIVHTSGDVIRIRLYEIKENDKLQLGPSVCLAFDDPDRNFDIQRPERTQQAKGEADA